MRAAWGRLSAASAAVAAVTSCSLGMTRLEDWKGPPEQPRCTDSPARPLVDTLLALTMFAGAIDGDENGDDGGRVAAALIGVAFGGASIYGFSTASGCSRAKRRYEEAMGGEWPVLASAESDQPAHPERSAPQSGARSRREPDPQPEPRRPPARAHEDAGVEQRGAAPARGAGEAGEVIDPPTPTPTPTPRRALDLGWSEFWTEGAPVARPWDRVVRGHVVLIEENELYLNLATATGVQVGAPVRIKRPIEWKHPVTGRPVADWVPVGTATLGVVGAQLSMARVDEHVLAAVKVGDAVEVLVAGTEPELAPEPEPEPEAEPDSEPLPRVDAATAALLDTWTESLGQPLPVRIGLWERFLERHPDSPYSARARDAVAELTALRDAMAPPDADIALEAAGGLDHAAPRRVEPGHAVPIVAVVDDPADALAAALYYRRAGAERYRRASLRREGELYFRGELPAALIEPPGVEYFVELTSRRRGAVAAIGAPEAPVAIAIPEPPVSDVFAPRANRSRVSVSGTFLDYATFDDCAGQLNCTDHAFWFEADFFYRLHRALYGVRAGFGSLQGEIADDPMVDEVRSVGFNFGYTELELRATERHAVMARLVAGVGADGFGLGAEGRLRLGPELGDNLSLGFSKIDQIGFLSEARLRWNAFPRFPLGFAVALTDQPDAGELGVRFTTDLGWRTARWFEPTLRISYQGRSVRHSGLGAGLAMVFDW